jgi:hypothetical protein
MSTCSTVRNGGALGADAQPTNKSGRNHGRKRIMEVIRVSQSLGRVAVAVQWIKKRPTPFPQQP